MRRSISFEITDPDFTKRLLAWASGQNVCCVLNSNSEQNYFKDTYSKFDFIAAVGMLSEFRSQNSELENSFDSLKQFRHEKNDSLFGFFTYDLKNETEMLSSENEDGLEFPEIYFFQPRWVFSIENQKIKIDYSELFDDESTIQRLFDEISETIVDAKNDSPVFVQQKISRNEYITNIAQVKQHIQRGDVYEMNYCMEFFAENAEVNPLKIYERLNEISPMPFSAFLKINHYYALCASPERFLAKRGSKLISQPIKGTAKRGKTEVEDEQIKIHLMNDPKERSENVMIVDLIRNDLSRTAKKGSVQVEELFGVHTFRQLHQMISTVVSELREDADSTDAIRLAFPMGSMTGAPKIRAMQLIEEIEQTKRGLYSGSIGYFSPDGDFDFNVVIRTILFNREKKYLSFMVGSAITANADAEKEYDECLLKAKAMLAVLGL